MFESIKGIIGDIASGAIKDQRIALSQEQLAALESKLVSLAGELTASKARESKLVADNEKLRCKLEDSQPVEQPGEPCPFCRCYTGQLVELKKHPVFWMQGMKVAHYKCSNPQCGKTYEHDTE